MARRRLTYIPIIAILGVVFACVFFASEDMTILSGETQGTTYTVKITPRLSAEARAELESLIRDRLREVDRVFSLYREDSELKRLNLQRTTEPVPVSDSLLEVFRAARVVAEESGGAYDFTAAPLVAAWGFGPGNAKERGFPEPPEIARLLERVGYDKIILNEQTKTVRKTVPDVECDLNGIAQGYTVDCLARNIAARGYSDFLVEIGGEVWAQGSNVEGKPWRVAVESPAQKEHAVALDRLALTTAGDYRNYRERDGIRLSHIINPLDGKPVSHGLASVTVVHAQCMMADGYDTALMVLGPDAGYEFAAKKGLAAIFTRVDAEGRLTARATPEFEKRLRGM